MYVKRESWLCVCVVCGGVEMQKIQNIRLQHCIK